MTTTVITPPFAEEVLPRWLEELRASDRARGTIRRYKNAVDGFLAEHPGDIVGLACLLGHTSLDTTRIYS